MSKYIIITLFVAIIALSTVNAAIPSYIKVCKRNDPDVSKCIGNSVNALKAQLVDGIPELEVPSLDPLVLNELNLDLGRGFGAVAKRLQITGGKDFKIEKLVADLEGNTYSFTVSVPSLFVKGEYEIDAKIAGIPLKGKGPLTLTAKTLSGEATLRGKKVDRRGSTYNWFPSMDLKLNIKDYDIKLENLFEGDASIGDVTNKLLNDEKTEVLASLIPAMEKAITERVLTVANNICKHFTWDELFPPS